MAKLLTNAFSLNMLSVPNATVTVRTVEVTEAATLYRSGEYKSVVGHADTAAIFADVLGVAVPFNRESISFENAELLVGQYSGPRLAEGATKLPEGATVRWMVVTVVAA